MRAIVWMTAWVLSAAAMPVHADGAAAAPGLVALSADQRRARAADDLRRLEAYGRATDALRATLAAEKALFADKAVLSADERRRALELFAQVYTYSVALDRLADYHLEFWRIDPVRDAEAHARHFVLGFAAYVELLRLGYAFVTPTLDRPTFERLLDEGAPERDLPPGAYAQMKWNVVHVADVGELVAAQSYHKVLALTSYQKVLRAQPAYREILARLGVQLAALNAVVLRQTGKMLVKNGLDILRDKGHQGWFPIQADVAEWLGDTRVADAHRALISPAQIAEAVHWSRPGDVIV